MCRSGVGCTECNDEDVSGDCAKVGAHVGVEMACSSAMPGCAALSSVQTWPPRFSESLALRTTGSSALQILFLADSSRGLLAMTFSLVRVSSSALIGGLGRALFFCIGGLTRRGGVGSASFSSTVPLVAFSEPVDW